MNRVVVLSAAALDAVVAAAIGLAVCVLPAIVIWALHYGMSGSLAVPWQAGGDVWLLGHGVDLIVSVPAASMVLLGLPVAAGAFPITMAATGLGLVTAILCARIGYRLDEEGHPRQAAAMVTVVFLGTGLAVTLSTRSTAVAAVTWQGILLPALVALGGVGCGIAFHRATHRSRVGGTPSRRVLPGAVQRLLRLADPQVRDGIAYATRGAAAAVLIFVSLAAVTVAAQFVDRYAPIVGLYESIHAGVWGGLVVTLAQIVLIPNAVAFSMAWLAGPGFAVGAGTAVTPLGVRIGALPALPLFGAVPRHASWLGLATLLVPLAAGVAAGLLVRRRLGSSGRFRGPIWFGSVAAGIGILSGLTVGLAVWWTSGAIGPERLQEFGAGAFAVGAAAAAEVALGAAFGLFWALPARLRWRHVHR